jgi:hypothetical protein
MKKVFSWMFFILTLAVFVFDTYVAISGAIDVNRQLAELAAREASGHELLGVGLDILVFGVVLVSAVGVSISLISWKIAWCKAIRVISAVMCSLFLFPIFAVATIMTL